jgi:DNA-binding CsgD family transcriptional regulator
MEHLRGQIAFDQRRVGDAARLLLSAARRLEPLDTDSARETYLEALGAALWAGDPGGVLQVAQSARAAPPGRDPQRVVDVLLDALALRLTEGYAAAAPALTRALERFLAVDVADDEASRWLILERVVVGLELWDAEAWHALAARQVEFARDTGALVHLQLSLNLLAWTHIVAGELTAAAQVFEEDRLIAEAIGIPPVAYNEMILAAWRGRQAPASELIEATLQEATAGGRGVISTSYARSVLYNGLGRHDAARDAARRVFERDQLGYGPLVVPELAEAASRTGDVALVETVLEWLSERTRVTPSEWALGIEARVRALLSAGDVADGLYRESIERLGRTRVRVEVARGHLLYGEWLRREGRRTDAREHLRSAHEMLDTMGVEAFAERARRELLATGETARKRTVETRDELTAQEAQIARLARDGLSNPEIGARLFISRRTVEYHLHKVFAKLDISSRNHLHRALSLTSPGTGDPD